MIPPFAVVVSLAVFNLLSISGCGGCRPVTAHPPKKHAILFVGGKSDDTRRRDVVFIHGLMGDARDTWLSDDKSKFFWPEALVKEFPDSGVWSIDYDASPSDWLGGTMPVIDRSKNLLEQLAQKNVGQKPLVFVCHSLGGIVVKQMLRHSLTLGKPEWESIGKHTKGVVFLATPHTGSYAALLVNYVSYFAPNLKTTVTLQELEPNANILADLNEWYRNAPETRNVKTHVLYETLPMLTIKPPIIIVDRASSDPGIKGAPIIPVDADHVSISKPSDTDSLVFTSAVGFIRKTLIPASEPYEIEFEAFVKEFNGLRHNPKNLRDFLRKRVGQKVSWNAVIIKMLPDPEHPAYSIGPTAATKLDDQVLASFDPLDFDYDFDLSQNRLIAIEGTVSDGTALNGAVLEECKMIPPPSKK
jgi:hypothetical protein